MRKAILILSLATLTGCASYWEGVWKRASEKQVVEIRNQRGEIVALREEIVGLQALEHAIKGAGNPADVTNWAQLAEKLMYMTFGAGGSGLIGYGAYRKAKNGAKNRKEQ